jgi:predicted RNA-binding Zn ribbon-like protein
MRSVAEMPFVAGNPALDFVNTAEERGHPNAGDALMTANDLCSWGQRYGLITRAVARDTAMTAEFKQAVEARELLYTLFYARTHQRPLARPDLTRLAQLASSAYAEATVDATSDGTIRWRWNQSRLATIRHVAVTSAIDILTTGPTTRLKQCPGDHCGWFFLDTTKRGNRRWCSMSECGQEAKNRGRRKAATEASKRRS